MLYRCQISVWIDCAGLDTLKITQNGVVWGKRSGGKTGSPQSCTLRLALNIWGADLVKYPHATVTLYFPRCAWHFGSSFKRTKKICAHSKEDMFLFLKHQKIRDRITKKCKNIVLKIYSDPNSDFLIKLMETINQWKSIVKPIGNPLVSLVLL